MAIQVNPLSKQAISLGTEMFIFVAEAKEKGYMPTREQFVQRMDMLLAIDKAGEGNGETVMFPKSGEVAG